MVVLSEEKISPSENRGFGNCSSPLSGRTHHHFLKRYKPTEIEVWDVFSHYVCDGSQKCVPSSSLCTFQTLPLVTLHTKDVRQTFPRYLWVRQQVQIKSISGSARTERPIVIQQKLMAERNIASNIPRYPGNVQTNISFFCNLLLYDDGCIRVRTIGYILGIYLYGREELA